MSSLDAQKDVMTMSRVDGEKMCMNVYDVRLLDKEGACGANWPPPLADVTTYLGVSCQYRLSDFCLIMLFAA